MQTPRPFILSSVVLRSVVLLSIGLWSLNSAHAVDETVTGNLTVTGSIGSVGQIDSDSNQLSFGPGTTPPVELIYADADNDTFKFSLNRTVASWLWQHTTIAAMRLDSAHQLILYQADGTTAGLTFAPASNSIKLGTHANGTLTADANGVITAGGGFTVAGNFTNTNGTLTGGASGLNLNAGGTDQSITLTPNGTGVIALMGKVGIGTTTPAEFLEIKGDYSGKSLAIYTPLANNGAGSNVGWYSDTTGSKQTIAFVGAVNDGDNARRGKLYFQTANDGPPTVKMAIDRVGNVGIGTTSPGGKLEVIGGSNPFGLIVEGDGVSANARIALRRANATGVSATGNIDWIGNDNAVGARIGVNDDVGGSMAFKLGGSAIGNTRLFISSAGNVGIGTTSPAISGDARELAVSAGTSGDSISAIVMQGSRTIANGRVSTLYGFNGSNLLGYQMFLTGNEANSGKIGFVTYNAGAAVDAMMITQSGNVGIGTTNPTYKLDVNGAVASYGSTNQYLIAHTTAGSGTNAAVEIRGGASNADWLIGTNRGDIWGAGDTLAFYKNAGAYGAKMVIQDNGNVGIGTTSPNARLELVGGSQLRFGSNGNSGDNSIYLRGGTSGDKARIILNHYNYKDWTIAAGDAGAGKFSITGTLGGADGIVMDTSGNVGIGTTAPDDRLHVLGGKVKIQSSANGYGWIYGEDTNHSIIMRGDRNGTAVNATNYYQYGGTLADGTTGHRFWTGGLLFDQVERMRIANDGIFMAGNVGIGTTGPTGKLQVAGVILTTSAATANLASAGGMDFSGGSLRLISWGANATTQGGYIFNSVSSDASLNTNPLVILPSGNVGIGTVSPTAKLAVNGTIRAKEVIVDTGWADYVFAEDYRLAPLAEVEEHIREKKHLPGIPSAAEVAEHGVSMGDMQARLLSKVEELTLHLIAQQKQLLAQDERLGAQQSAHEKEIATLRQQVAELKVGSAHYDSK